MGDDVISDRRKRLFSFLIARKNLLIYLVIIFIGIFGFTIRINNLEVLNGYLADPDAHVFLRYARSIVDTGTMPVVDKLRYYPLGFDPRAEFGLLSYFIAYLYYVVNFFNSSITLEFVDIIYPAIAFAFGIFFFFLLVRRLFDYRVAILSAATLTIVPAFLFRTMSGVSDKEALAMPLMFLSLYLFVAAWQSNKVIAMVFLSVFSGIFTGLTALTWGGVVYALVAIGGFAFIETFLMKFRRKDVLVYVLWTVFTLLVMNVFGHERYSLSILMSSLTTGIMLLSFLYVVVNFLIVDMNLFKLKEKLLVIKFPITSLTFIMTVLLIIVLTGLIFGPFFVFNVVAGVVGDLYEPQQNNRWSLTVAENRQVYVANWFGDFSVLFVWLFIIASIFLFYEMVKNVARFKWGLTLSYTLFILGFIFSRFSPSSRLNGENFLSDIVLSLSILIMLGYLIYVYFYTYYIDRKSFEQIQNIDKKYSLIFLWFLLGIIGAKASIRLLFPFAPIASFLFGFIVFMIVDYIRYNKNFQNKLIKLGAYLVILFLVLYIFAGFMKITNSQSKVIGPIYNLQWQMAGNWVNNNTPVDSVFVHWWDYGYLVQTGFNRATVTDGGNAIGPWNYYVGRNVLTAQNELEPLAFLKTHDVSYLLIVSEDIGKYTAYSSIGSDESYDRFSWIGTYVLSPQTQETRNTTILLYQGGVSLDADFVFEGKLLPRQNAGIAGFFVPVEKQESGITAMLQPTAVIVYNNQRYDIPLECVFIDGKEVNFEKKGMAGCLRIIPSIDSNNNINQFGAALYLSPKVRNTLFAKLYVYGTDSEIYKVVYTDENDGAPLALWRGRLIGPLKIWKINYPEGVEKDARYLETTYTNPNVTFVKKGYY